ncbi:hypothetical protein SARC_13339 [Sphaeroforma arctica JP610]|uniref:Uncharacterized protein n=1 Tax=Sphaeroforma arctica JP610 TaxID=667725 RepID=A0A0L0FCC4_9EUKA|nr:hypothetical protein SARC_13339 [Sphaeroforma arctica JP610]KNC74106.1 hypothetical protein SARC_13339 [Sphaeroforma arctica JP610]|eukprot:XP_014148008.1 hypothetical protein SARC_13339 [Sphaeroforma arctica JP610]
MVPPPNSLVLWLPGVVHAEVKIKNERVMSRDDISFQNNKKARARHVQDNVVYGKKTQFGKRRDILPAENPRFIEAVKDAQNRVEPLDGSKSTHNTKPTAQLETRFANTRTQAEEN